MKSNEIKNEFIARRGLGESYKTISMKLSVSEKTLKRWGGIFGDKIREAQDHGLGVAIDLHNLAKSGRLQKVAEELERIDTELGKRDLSAVPVSKLVMLKFAGIDLAGKIIGIEGQGIPDSRSPWDTMMSFLQANVMAETQDNTYIEHLESELIKLRNKHVESPEILDV